MKPRTLFSVAFSAVLILTMLLTSCAPVATPTTAPTTAPGTVATTEPPTQEPVVTITFWHGYNADVETPLLEGTLIPAFEASHPNIKVESVLVPYDQFRRKLLIALSGGTSPDLARIDIIWTPQLADQGALADLSVEMPDFATYSQAFLPGPLSTNLYNGKYYGLPLDTNTRVLAYNKDMFTAAGIANPPATMDEFLAACEKIKALGPDKYCFADGGTYAWAVNPWIWSFGGDVTDPGVTTADGYYNSPETVAAYTFLKDGIDMGYINPAMAGGGIDTWGGFGNDQIAMIIEGPWFPSIFEGQFPDTKYGLALMPAGAGGSISVVGGEDIVLFQQSTRKQAALEFMKYMLSEDVQLQLVATGQMPVLKSAIDSDTIKNHAFFGIFLQQLETAKARTPHPNWSKIEEVMTNTGAAILLGQVDAQKGLDDAVLLIEPLLPIQ
jgi:multiple sugar transport system substrate-binding protein